MVERPVAGGAVVAAKRKGGLVHKPDEVGEGVRVVHPHEGTVVRVGLDETPRNLAVAAATAIGPIAFQEEERELDDVDVTAATAEAVDHRDDDDPKAILVAACCERISLRPNGVRSVRVLNDDLRPGVAG